MVEFQKSPNVSIDATSLSLCKYELCKHQMVQERDPFGSHLDPFAISLLGISSPFPAVPAFFEVIGPMDGHPKGDTVHLGLCGSHRRASSTGHSELLLSVFCGNAEGIWIKLMV